MPNKPNESISTGFKGIGGKVTYHKSLWFDQRHRGKSRLLYERFLRVQTGASWGTRYINVI